MYINLQRNTFLQFDNRRPIYQNAGQIYESNELTPGQVFHDQFSAGLAVHFRSITVINKESSGVPFVFDGSVTSNCLPYIARIEAVIYFTILSHVGINLRFNHKNYMEK